MGARAQHATTQDRSLSFPHFRRNRHRKAEPFHDLECLYLRQG